MKLYVKSGSLRWIVLADSAIAAAVKCLAFWQARKLRAQSTIRVSEVGFDGDHPHHEKDHILATRFVKAKMRSDE